VPADNPSICSATPTLICLGRAPVAGCGAILTSEERHWYGDCCEACTRAWGERVSAYQSGEQDPELDKIYGGQPPTIN
jgi:hypothetical protein